MTSTEPRPLGPSGSQSEINPTLKKDLFQVNADLYTAVSLWLRKHGKGVKPKLSEEQKQQMKECFDLMDQDGSGAIDAEELGAAFKLLGIKMKRAELEALLAEVDHDGSGEVEYPEFLEIMTVTLQRLADEEDSDKNEGQVPFGLMATAYRRKRLMEGIINGHKEVQAQIQQISDKANLEALQATKAAEMEAVRTKSVDSSSGGASTMSNSGMLPTARSASGRPVRRYADVNRTLLETLGPDERRIVNSLTPKVPPIAPPRVHPSSPPSMGVVHNGTRQYGHFTNSPSHRQLLDTPQLLDLRFVHSSTIRLPPGATGFVRTMSGGLSTGGAGSSGGGFSAATAALRESSSAGAVPPVAVAARNAASLRIGAGQLGQLSGSASAPIPSPGRFGRSEEGLPQLRHDAAVMLHAGGKQTAGGRLGTLAAWHERISRG